MLTITVQVDAPPGQAIGIKEALAMYLSGTETQRWCLSWSGSRSRCGWIAPERSNDQGLRPRP